MTRTRHRRALTGCKGTLPVSAPASHPTLRRGPQHLTPHHRRVVSTRRRWRLRPAAPGALATACTAAPAPIPSQGCDAAIGFFLSSSPLLLALSLSLSHALSSPLLSSPSLSLSDFSLSLIYPSFPFSLSLPPPFPSLCFSQSLLSDSRIQRFQQRVCVLPGALGPAVCRPVGWLPGPTDEATVLAAVAHRRGRAAHVPPVPEVRPV